MKEPKTVLRQESLAREVDISILPVGEVGFIEVRSMEQYELSMTMVE